MTRAGKRLSTPRRTASKIQAEPVANRDLQSEAVALVERCQKGDRRWTVLWNKIDKAEKAAEPQHGRRPIALIAWRNYSHIGGSELERARDDFIRQGIDGKLVQEEYRSAKQRYRAALQAEVDWDCKAGLSDLRKKLEEVKLETGAAQMALEKVHLTSIKDAVAIIGLLRKRIRIFEELSDDWEVAAFMNVSRFLVQAAS